MSARSLIGMAAVLAACPPISLGAAQATTCSVFDAAPCAPTFCSVLRERPCRPDLPFPFGDGLRLTIQGQRGEPARRPDKPLNTIQELFDAFSACWVPPPLDRAKPRTEITIRFSLNRAGEILGEPRFTYSTPTLSSEVKSAYQKAVADAISRCTPFPLSKALGGAIAGRPISTRFIDDRGERRTENAR